MFDLRRRLFAEALGPCLLVATVVGSGIMADRLTDDSALALLGNTLPTGAILMVLITILGPISGAHFNPVVSMVAAIRGNLPFVDAAGYVVAQIVGGIIGTVLAHAMFELPLRQPMARRRRRHFRLARDHPGRRRLGASCGCCRRRKPSGLAHLRLSDLSIYSERKEAAAKLEERVGLKSI